MSRKSLAWLAISTLFIKLIWLLHPDMMLQVKSIPTYQMFPFAKDIWITKPTYISFMCEKLVWLVIILIWGELLPEYKMVFGALFIIQALQFVEFFLNYNYEPWFWFYIGNHKIDIDLTLAKLTIPSLILLYQQIWKGK